MTTVQMTWLGIAGYVAVTVALTIRGAMKTSSMESYAVGSGDIPPALVGLSLSAQLTSVATFVVNPGLVYYFGFSGLMGLGGAAAAGIVLGLTAFSGPFRKVGSTVKALTIPQWIGTRYQSPGLRLLFGLISLALISFAVLIVVAIAKILGALLQVDPTYLVVGVVVFVFAYVMIGGANTHAYTNAIQALIMLVVALILIGSGIAMFTAGKGLLGELASISPNLASVTNPKSLYFRNLFEVFVCNFLVGLAIVCQPHILGKALYLKKDSQVPVYLTVAIIAGIIFVAVMLVGLYARVKFAGAPLIKIDSVVATYIAKSFSPTMQVVVGIGILCAGISTLEGILLALSTIISIDLFLPAVTQPGQSEEETQKLQGRAITIGRIGLVIVGVLCILLSFWQIKNPTGGSVAIFAQYGVYLLFTVSFFPLACGMFFPKVNRVAVASSVLTALMCYMMLSFSARGWGYMGVILALPLLAMATRTASIFLIVPISIGSTLATYGVVAALGGLFMTNNPGFLAAIGIIAGWLVIAGVTLGGVKDPDATESDPAEEAAEATEAAGSEA